MKNIKSIIFIIAILTITIILVINRTNKSKAESSTGTKSTPKVKIVAKVLSKDTLNTKTFVTGSLIPWKMIDLQTEIAGRVVLNNIVEGKTYAKGDLLIQLNDDELKAELNKQKADLKLWTAKEKRIQQLINKEAISLEELDEATAKIAQINADIDLIESKIRKSKLLAPFDGKIGISDITEGTYLSPGTSISQYFQTDNIKVEFDVPEKYKSEVKVGDVISFKSLNKSKSATVYAIEPLINNQTRTFKVRAKAGNPDKILTPGAYTEIELGNNTTTISYMVPTNAIIFGKPKPIVYIVKEGKAIPKPVDLGLRTEVEIQIIDGLSPLDTVIVGGLALVKPNAQVSIDQLIKE